MVDKSGSMNVYKVYNSQILHPAFQKTFQYSIEGGCLTFSFDGEYVILPPESDILTCVVTKGYMCQFDAALYPTETVYGGFTHYL